MTWQARRHAQVFFLQINVPLQGKVGWFVTLRAQLMDGDLLFAHDL